MNWARPSNDPTCEPDVQRLRGFVVVGTRLRAGCAAVACAARAGRVGAGAGRAERRSGGAGWSKAGLKAIYLSGWQGRG